MFVYVAYSLNNIYANIVYLCQVLLNNKFLNIFLLSTISSVIFPNFKSIYWYPIFKRHSIFGYYRIARQNWVELKSEEVNYLKY